MYQFYYFNNPFQYKYIGCLAMFISAHVHICPCMFLPKLISAHTFLPMYISAHLFLPIRFAFTVIVIFPPVLSYNSHTRRYCPDIAIERLSIALIQVSYPSLLPSYSHHTAHYYIVVVTIPIAITLIQLTNPSVLSYNNHHTPQYSLIIVLMPLNIAFIELSYPLVLP